MAANLNILDLLFLQAQVLAGNTPAPGADPLAPDGIRTLDGSNNNISGFVIMDQHGNVVNTSTFGNLDQAFIDIGSTTSPLTYLNSTEVGFNPFVTDSSPRTVSNLIADQTAANPATEGVDLLHPGDPTIDVLPANSWFTFFGQFFDHGLDFVAKGGHGTIAIPLLESDPLYDPTPGAVNMMFLTRATLDANGNAINTTAPFIEQSQTYGSTDATSFYLKEYDASGNATGDLVAGVDGLATWADIKANALQWAIARAIAEGGPIPTEMLTDAHVLDIPDPAMWDVATASFLLGAETGQAFLADIAHFAVPVFDVLGDLAPDADTVINASGFGVADPDPATYDNELLDAHFVAGDPRANENTALSAVHEVFHNEHSRILAEIKNLVAQQDEIEPGFAAGWDGEMYFQATKLVNEMQYQHLVFEEFARRMSPNIDAFAAYDVTINPNITSEFAHAIYRLGHSQLTDNVKATDVTGQDIDISLVDAFLDPELFSQFGGADFAKGAQFEQGSQIDEFVVDSLRNFLVGLPLDLAALNIARGRETGLPSLNQLRAELYAETGETSLQPYTSWADFGANLLNPGSLVNFIAAYSTDVSLTSLDNTSATYTDDLRAAATLLMEDSAFMNGGDDGFESIDLWIGGLAEAKVPLGMLGSTFDFIFAQQLIALQNGDRFYYLGRLGGNLLDEIEGQTFADLIMRGTDARHLNGDTFGTPDVLVELGSLGIMDLIKSPAELVEILHEVIGGTNDDNVIDGGAGNDTIWGDGGNDLLRGGAADDHVYGGDGDDVIFGEVGFDFLRGDAGNDEIHGGSDDDAIFGGDGDDELFGDQGFDAISGQAGNDIIHGGNQDDAVLGGDGDDIIFGDAGDDSLDGELGNDVIYGGIGDDLMNGLEGDDLLIGGAGADALDGGVGGYDIASYETWLQGVPPEFAVGLSINVGNPLLSTGDARDDSYLDIEAIRGTNYDDSIVGDDLVPMTLIGGLGDDTIQAGAAGDTLIGSEGDDIIIGGVGIDTVLFRGLQSEFTITNGTFGTIVVTDNNAANGDEGIDTISGVEWISFDNALRNITTGQYAPLIDLTNTTTRTHTVLDFDATQLAGSDVYTTTEVIGELQSTLTVNDGTQLTGVNGLSVANINIFDPDGANGGARVFTLAGPDAAFFTVANVGGINQLFLSGNGPLSSTNFEVKPYYEVSVTVTDGIGSSTVNYRLDITDVNDNAPVIVSGDRSNVRENVSTDTIVYSARTTDMDTTGEAITYSLSGADAAMFSMINGEIRFLATPDFETPLSALGTNDYQLTINATDGVNPATSKDITIHVTNAPAALAGDTAAIVVEDSAAPAFTTATGSLAAADPGDPVETFTTLTSGTSTYGAWTIDGAGNWTYTLADGHADVDALNDGESLTDSFEVVSDAGTTQLIAITIEGADDPIIFGTNGADVPLDGTQGVDDIRAREGDDTINGYGGDDRLFGQDGNDTINGDEGADRIIGGNGNDNLSGGAGSDVLNGQQGVDVLNGGDGDDLLVGDTGSDTLNGDGGNDRLYGGADIDILNGGDGDDILNGGGGDDLFEGGTGNDVMLGGGGIDTFIFSNGFGDDKIVDFTDGVDIIDLSVFGLTDGMADLLISQIGSTAVIKLDADGDLIADTADQIRIAGINATVLDATDFIFV